MTYARLMLMAEEDAVELKPDFIILDEFHRCGAEEWRKGVQKLLAVHPKALLVGLTATNIRYLDNQRDMANALFDGCVAHHMTLGEAIVRGCLPAPRYIFPIIPAKRIWNVMCDEFAKRAEQYSRQPTDIWISCAEWWNRLMD